MLMSSNAYISNSNFTDNYATKINHGITMITSNLEFYSSNVSQTDELLQQLDLSKLDTGFFNLYLGSNIYLG